MPQGWKLEYAGWDPTEAWARSREIALLGERLGYDHLWVYDHFETVPRREPEPVFEAWTMMAALAELTDPARLGQLVTCAAYRRAGMLAKQAACVDVVSGGWLILGIGAGWSRREYSSHGYAFPPPRGAAGGPGGDPGGGQGPVDRGRGLDHRGARLASTAPSATRSPSRGCPRSGWRRRRAR